MRLAFTVKEFAASLGVHEDLIYEAIHDHKKSGIPFKRIKTRRGTGKKPRIVIPLALAEKWLAENDFPKSKKPKGIMENSRLPIFPNEETRLSQRRAKGSVMNCLL